MDAGPHFLGIGAHKAGTSWLHWQLRQHPDVWLPPVKEVHYFDRSDKYPSPSELQTVSPWSRALQGPEQRARLRRGYWALRSATSARDWASARWAWKWYFGRYTDRWYRRLFRTHGNSRVCGEITPAYSMLDRRDLAALRRINPQLKLIFMLRNPIDRAWSSVRFNNERGFSDADLASEDDILAQLKGRSTVLRGDYLATLDAYLSVFPPERVLVGFYDAISADPAGLINGVLDFLDLPATHELEIDNTRRVNASRWRPMPKRIRRYLTDTYRPTMQVLADRFGGYAERWLLGAGGDGRLGVDANPRAVVNLGAVQFDVDGAPEPADRRP